MDGEVNLELSHAEIDGILVVIIDVSPAIMGRSPCATSITITFTSERAQATGTPDRTSGKPFSPRRKSKRS
jgi:hypothetical protein